MSQEVVDAIDEYSCRKCTILKRRKTTWKLEEAAPIKSKEKKDFYFEVESILDHRIDNMTGKRDFLVRWKGYPVSASSFEPEEHLDGCYPILQEYCRLKKIEFSTIEGIVGATKDASEETINWVKPSKILETYLKLKPAITPSNIPAKILDSMTVVKDEDTLYFVPFKGHCYVILYYGDNNLGYVADGKNQFDSHEDIAEELTEYVGIPLVGRKYDHQTADDHCGSSAVIIGLMLARHYHLNLKPDTITAPPRIRKRVKARFHPNPSGQIEKKILHKFGANLKCDLCGKKFSRGKIANLECHMVKAHRCNK